jgi:voltage-gated potassium channel Kch
MLKELREHIRYLVDRAFAREFLGQLLLFAVLVVVVTVIGMSAIAFGLFSAENAGVEGIPRRLDSGFFDSLWWSLNQVLTLRGFQRMYGASGPILLYALFLSVSGLAVFGLLVSIINNAMRRRIEVLRTGETPVKERGHTLILGWNKKIFTVLRELAHLDPDSRVVILAPKEIGKMENALRVAGIGAERVTTILRSGVPSNLRELERVALERAASIVILATDDDDRDSIKTLVLLAGQRGWRHGLPAMTAEIVRDENYELAQIAARNRIHIISSSRVISKVIVQTIRNPGLAAVYSELLEVGGNKLSVHRIPEIVDKTLGEISYGFADAIPVGVSWRTDSGDGVRHAAGLNPGPDYEIADDEKVVMLARGREPRYRGLARPAEPASSGAESRQPKVPERVLVIGWHELILDVLQELNAHALTGTEITILSMLEAKDVEERIREQFDDSLRNLTLRPVKGDAAEARPFRELDIRDFESIVVLADDAGGKVDADSRTLRVLLRLSSLPSWPQKSAHLTVELLDDANRDLLEGLGVDDVVVSPEIVSAQLAQVSRQPVLGPIYRELLSAGGVEISLRPATDYVDPEVDCRFDELAAAAQSRMEIALGLRLADGARLLLNPPRDAAWRLGESDRVVVLAQQVYR